MQHNKDVDHQYVNMYCATNKFPELQFIGTHNKAHGVCGLGKYHHICFDYKLGHGTCSIHCIRCDYNLLNSIMEQHWVPGLKSQQQPCYQPVQDCTYWPVLGSFNNWNIIQLSHKETCSEEIDKIHQVVLYDISENISALVQTDEYGAINTTDTYRMGYYVIKFMP